MAYGQVRQDSSGTLKTTISLGRTPSIVHSGPFYLMKEPPESSELTGATNLITHHRLSSTYLKLLSKKKNELGAFLNHLTGVDVPSPRDDLNSTLKSLMETRIISNKEILPMTATQFIGFRLQSGQIPAHCRLNQIVHKKHKKHRKKQKSSTHESHSLADGSGPSETADPNVAERKKKDKKKVKKDKKDRKDKKRKTHGQASGNDD